jgi:uncharacterized RDD family membrane protein YckC
MASYGDPTAKTGKRVGAYAIDALLLTGLLFIGFLVSYDRVSVPGNICRGEVQQQGDQEIAFDMDASGFCFYMNDPSQGTDESIVADGSVWMMLAFPALYIVLGFVVLTGVAGGSPGKLLVGLRVVREDGSPAGLGPAAIRTALWVVDGFPGYCFCFFAPVVGFIVMMTTKRHQRVGDLVAKTFVVPVASAGMPLGSAASSGHGTPWGTPAGDPMRTPTPAPDGQGVPQWDDARKAWIQYSPVRGQWLQHNPLTDTWGQIS